MGTTYGSGSLAELTFAERATMLATLAFSLGDLV